MLFNSLLFLLFFIIVTGTYYLTAASLRWALLLIASCYFYMYFRPSYLLIILFTVVIDYLAGILIEKTTGNTRLLLLWMSIIANVGVLAFYKYFNFIALNFNTAIGSFHGPQIPLLHILLPIGLSFHTFQAMSYTIEVYRGNQKAERHFGIYALYVLFYPQMVAGPIERPQHILPQLHGNHKFVLSTFTTGVLLIFTGLFKKVVIADRLGLYIDPIFSDPHHHSGLELIIGVYFFAFQIYCDFSGYSEIAVGAALTLGIRLMANFDTPYLSQNISEFWARWHISLSTWFRDYVYIPLGGSKAGFIVTCVNILVVFAISGLWHGADWKYVIWGLIHGIFLILYKALKKIGTNIRLYPILNWFTTFNLVCIAWIFFRANSLADSFYIVEKVFFGHYTYSAGGIMTLKEIAFCIFLISTLIIAEPFFKQKEQFSVSKKLSTVVLLAVACYFFGIFNEAQFIYFQF